MAMLQDQQNVTLVVQRSIYALRHLPTAAKQYFLVKTNVLSGGFKHVLFSPKFGELGKISNLSSIFQMGWNHQPLKALSPGGEKFLGGYP